jgi:hypothetical protein
MEPLSLFAMLTDEELAARLASGELTESASKLAAAELQSRGIDLPACPAPVVPIAGEYLGDMVLLERGLTATQAHIMCSMLRSAGIHADAGDTNFVQTYALLTIAVGGANVRVPASQLEEAKSVLAAFLAGDFSLDDDFCSDVDGPRSEARHDLRP